MRLEASAQTTREWRYNQETGEHLQTSPNEKGLAKLRTLFPWGKPFILLRHSCFVILFCVILQTSVACAYRYIHINIIYIYCTITYTYRQPYPVVADSISFPKTVPMAVWGLQALAEGLPSSGHLGSNFGQAWAGCAQDLTSCCWEWFFTWVFFKPRGLVDAYSLSHRIHGAGIYANIKGVLLMGSMLPNK